MGTLAQGEGERRFGQVLPTRTRSLTAHYLYLVEDNSVVAPDLSDFPSCGSPVTDFALWLSRKPGRYRAIRWARNPQGQIQAQSTEVVYANGEKRSVRRPLLEVFEPRSAKEVEGGTVARGSATCPVTGFTTAVKIVREQLKTRHGGAYDARLICIVETKPGQTGRHYRIPTERDEKAVSTPQTSLSDFRNSRH